jgi:hypothetical protein
VSDFPTLETLIHPLEIPDNFDTSLVYYTACAVSGIEHFNKPFFAQQNAYLRAEQIETRSPMEIKMPADVTWQEAMRLDLSMVLAECRGIIMLEGWIHSPGANLELYLCQRLEYPSWSLVHYGTSRAELIRLPKFRPEELKL